MCDLLQSSLALQLPDRRMGMCTVKRSMDCKDHTSLLQVVMDATNNKQDMTGLKIISLASDGESRWGKALTN